MERQVAAAGLVEVEQHLAHELVGVVVEVGEAANVGEFVEQLEARLRAEVRERRLRHAAAHRAEGVVAPGRETGERLPDERLGVFGQVGEVELLLPALELDEVRRELHAAASIELHREAEEHRRIAGRAAVHEPDLRGLVLLQHVEVRNRDRRDVREHAALRAIEGETALLVVLQATRRIDVDGHASLQPTGRGSPVGSDEGDGRPLCRQPAKATAPRRAAACSAVGAAGRRRRPCAAAGPARTPGSCPRTRRPRCRPRRRGCGSRCGRGTSGRAR